MGSVVGSWGLPTPAARLSAMVTPGTAEFDLEEVWKELYGAEVEMIHIVFVKVMLFLCH